MAIVKKINKNIMLSELTIEQASKAPANFLYIWASDEFLNAISQKYANIIRVKKANQTKLLMLSAKKYLGDSEQYTQYTSAIREGFINIYGITPAEALIKLASGETVAGKNWSKGVYGIGTTRTNTFSGSDGLSVDSSTGHILLNGVDVTDSSKTVYGSYGKKGAMASQLFYTDANGNTYMSQYDEKKGKYYAQSISDKDGNIKNAWDGAASNASDSADMWANIVLIIEQFINWLISLFSGGSKETLSEENTLPNQKTDGFVQEAGLGEAGGLLLLLAAGGALMASGTIGGKKKSK